jgi:YfdX protein
MGADLERQRRVAEEEAEKTLDKDAIAAIEETEAAIKAIDAIKPDEARAAIERATGKISSLLDRNPAIALIPVDLEVDVIDTAPHDRQVIMDLAKDTSKAIDDMEFPTARLLLQALMSEIRVRTYNLPLATYPIALKEAARSLEQKRAQDASKVLLTALSTLVAVDHVTPIPLILARAAIIAAQDESKKDRAVAQKLLETAKSELQRSKDLGYAGKDADYMSLNQQISNLEKGLKANQDTAPAFAQLKYKLGSLLKRQSDRKQRE